MQYPRPAYVAADLAVTKLATALEAHGFDPTKPALFTCEGIFCYLPQVAAAMQSAPLDPASAANACADMFPALCNKILHNTL